MKVPIRLRIRRTVSLSEHQRLQNLKCLLDKIIPLIIENSTLTPGGILKNFDKQNNLCISIQRIMA